MGMDRDRLESLSNMNNAVRIKVQDMENWMAKTDTEIVNVNLYLYVRASLCICVYACVAQSGLGDVFILFSSLYTFFRCCISESDRSHDERRAGWVRGADAPPDPPFRRPQAFFCSS